MLLAWKEDWPAARQRLEAWWQGEALERVALQVTAPKAGAVRPSQPSLASLPALDADATQEQVEAAWLDLEARLERFERAAANTFYGGEAYPSLTTFFSSDSLSAYLGCACIFSAVQPDTIWFKEALPRRELPLFALTPDNKWWRATLEMTALAAERSQGRYFVGHTDIGGVGDVLSHLRGPQQLCLDLADDAEWVREMERRLEPLWFAVYEQQEALLVPYLEGSDGWLHVWGPGRTYPIQCDLSALISPGMFADVFLPYVAAQARWLDNCVYHLDGPSAIRHLDLLLDIPEIRAIQWVPGDGNGPLSRWLSLLHRIQQAGKSVVVTAQPNEIEALLDGLSPAGLLIQTSCASEAEAHQLLKDATTWT